MLFLEVTMVTHTFMFAACPANCATCTYSNEEGNAGTICSLCNSLYDLDEANNLCVGESRIRFSIKYVRCDLNMEFLMKIVNNTKTEVPVYLG